MKKTKDKKDFRRRARRFVARQWKAVTSFAFVKRFMPKSLFGRTFLIIVLPTFLALGVATFVFFDRHWDNMTVRMTHAVAGEIGVMIQTLDQVKDPQRKEEILAVAEQKLGLFLTFEPDAKLPPRPKGHSLLRKIMYDAMEERVGLPHVVDLKSEPNTVTIFVQLPKGLLIAQVPEKRIYIPTTEVFIGWMIGSSILLSIIALLFMRNQVRPVRHLAEAAEAIGKGQDVGWFKPEGANEVRQAASALLVMQDRLRRSVAQRTTMLAGVSHDLRTPLTRMKLELAMMPENASTRGFHSDVQEMETMLEAYLAFARGEEAEQTCLLDLKDLLEDVVALSQKENPEVALESAESVSLKLRPNAMRRLLTNLIMNALRYASAAHVSMKKQEYTVDIFVDDNGPGIPPERREEVFRPFLRLDASRNPETGGVGLGLTIARDIARSHGGDIELEDSPEGGLRAHLWLPV